MFCHFELANPFIYTTGVTFLDSVITDKITDKFRHSEGFKYFIGYQEDEIVKPLCIILPQMNGYIKYFENGGTNMSFLIKNSEVWENMKKIGM